MAPESKYDWHLEDVSDNGEFLTSATLVMFENGKEVGRETFHASSEFPNDGTATTLAASAGHSWMESMEYTLEQRLGPFGLEWEREQEERFYGDVPF